MTKRARVVVEVPRKDEILTGGVEARIAPKGTPWLARDLGQFANERGVYVIPHEGIVKYVGKTDGAKMSFGMRLRREFQETASQGRHIFPKLAALKVPPSIKVSFFRAETIQGLVHAEGAVLTNNQRIAMFEAALIQLYEPDFQT